jgi:uncharacterized membrane protein HdeD (DUF308 family)
MAKQVQKQKRVENLIIGKKNILIFSIGLLSLIIGFILMWQPPVNGFLSRTLAPVILIIAYLVIFPIAIMKKDKPTETGG